MAQVPVPASGPGADPPTDAEQSPGSGRPHPTGRRPLLVRTLAGVGLLVAVVALVGSLALALVRILQPESGRPLQLLAFVVAGAPAALVALVLGVIAAPSRRLRRRLGMPAAVLLGVHLWWLAPLYTGPVPAAASDCSLTVFSQNLEYGDGATLAAHVAAEHVDVLVVVEANSRTITPLLDAVHSELGQVVGLKADRSPAAVVVLSRFPVLDHAVTSDGRALRVRLDVPCLGPVEVVAAHPSPPPGAIYSVHAKALGDFVAAQLGPGLARGDTRAVLAGDLNSTLDFPVIRRLGELGFRDAAELANAGWLPTYPAPDTTRHWRIVWPPVVAIDHVLVSTGLTVSDVRTVALAGADHLGVQAVVRPGATG